MSNKQVLLANPGTGIFIQQVAKSLFEADLLSAFYTGFADNEQSRLRNLVCDIGNMFGKDLAAELSRRRITEIPRELVVTHPLGEMIRTIAARFDNDGRFADYVWEKSETNFDRWVSRNISADVGAVYGYEHACLNIFRQAEQEGLFRIYEVPAPEHDYVHEIIKAETAPFPELNTHYFQLTETKHKQRTQHRREEWELANLVIANSKFTKCSYEKAGLDVSKVSVIPLGCSPTVAEHHIRTSSRNKAPLKILWAGSFSVRKGAHYLLDAWRKWGHGELTVLGRQLLPKNLLRNLSETIQFHATIPKDQLSEKYLAADVLIFPTLCDGFGMVVSEALAHGLPVITTTRAGAADLIQHKHNGYIIESGSSDAIASAFQWFDQNRDALPEMRLNALNTARNWQWADFRQALSTVIKEHYHL
ncbi:MAG: glycosyltransferase family 4 protein [Gammaproteobacteria bacterium]|nr:glycosyltransferase family 4 protein [Gammaproteobacteria bacterium]